MKAGKNSITSRLSTQNQLPEVPELALELAKNGEPVPIPPRNTNLVGVVFKLQEIERAYLYSIIAIPPTVIDALRDHPIKQ